MKATFVVTVDTDDLPSWPQDPFEVDPRVLARLYEYDPNRVSLTVRQPEVKPTAPKKAPAKKEEKA